MVYLIATHRISSRDVTLKYVVNGITKTSIINIYWFFIPLFCIYLSIPLLATVSKEKKQYVYLYMVVLCFICNICIPFFVNVFNLEFEFPIFISVGSGYIIYLLIGYLLSKNDLSLGIRCVIYVLSVLGLLVHIIGTYKASINAGYIINTYKGYNNLPCVIYSVGVFVFIKNISEKITSDLFWKVINYLSKYTFCVYLMQWFIMDFIRNNISFINIYSMWYRLGAPVFIYAVCMVLTIIMRRIPIIRNIVP